MAESVHRKGAKDAEGIFIFLLSVERTESKKQYVFGQDWYNKNPLLSAIRVSLFSKLFLKFVYNPNNAVTHERDVKIKQ